MVDNYSRTFDELQLIIFCTTMLMSFLFFLSLQVILSVFLYCYCPLFSYFPETIYLLKFPISVLAAFSFFFVYISLSATFFLLRNIF